MFARIATALATAILATAAQAEPDYGACTEDLVGASALIAPVVPVVSATKVSEETVVLIVAGDDLGESIVGVSKRYQGALYALITNTPTEMWVGVIEGTDYVGTPSLWMHLWVTAHGGCFHGSVGERVYEKRANAPNVFWDAIYLWEKDHPGSALVRAN